jgi:hypothetical protein
MFSSNTLLGGGSAGRAFLPPPESPFMGLALVDDWTKPPKSTRASIEEGEHLGLLALQGRGGAKPGSPAQGIVFLGSRVVDSEVFTSWRGLICAVVSFSPITNEAGSCEGHAGK